MELTGKKALIMVEQQYNDYELWYPYYRLLEAGAEVSLLGPEAGQDYPGKEGTKAKTDLDMHKVQAKDYQVLIIPGGYAPDHLRRHAELVQLVRSMHEQGKVIAAICHAGWMLASAGILPGKNVTSVPAIKDDLVHAGAKWADQEVVRDGNLITSRKPADLPAFMREVISALS